MTSPYSGIPYGTGRPSSGVFQRLRQDLAAQASQAQRSVPPPPGGYGPRQPAVASVEEQINQLDESVEGWATDAAAGLMPSVQDGLMIARDAQHLNLSAILGLAEGKILANYLWWKEEHFEHVCNWLTACATGQDEQVRVFFIAHVRDMYYYDRALRAAEVNRLDMPLRYERLKRTITRSVGGRS